MPSCVVSLTALCMSNVDSFSDTSWLSNCIGVSMTPFPDQHFFSTGLGMARRSTLFWKWEIEVKSGRRVDRSDLNAPRSFQACGQTVKRRIVVFLGPRRQRIDEVEIIPLEEFLAELQ